MSVIRKTNIFLDPIIKVIETIQPIICFPFPVVTASKLCAIFGFIFYPAMIAHCIYILKTTQNWTTTRFGGEGGVDSLQNRIKNEKLCK